MSNEKKRISELEAECAALRTESADRAARIHELEAEKAAIETDAATRAARVHELEAQCAALGLEAFSPGGVTITTLPDVSSSLPDFPSFAQLVGLMLAVYRTFPSLRPKDWSAPQDATTRDLDWMTKDDHFLVVQFKKAFRWQRTVRRDSLDSSRLLAHATDQCERWLRIHRNDTVAPGGKIVLAALIAAGDVPFLNPSVHPLNMMQLGLRYEGQGGRPANHTAWQRVLSGNVPTGIHREAQQVSRVKITELNVAAHHLWRQDSSW